MDLLEKRAAVYSDRPNFTVVGELMGLNQVKPALVLRRLFIMLVCFRACLYSRTERNGASSGN